MSAGADRKDPITMTTNVDPDELYAECTSALVDVRWPHRLDRPTVLSEGLGKRVVKVENWWKRNGKRFPSRSVAMPARTSFPPEVLETLERGAK